MVYFITLEVLSDLFHHKSAGKVTVKWQYLRRKARLSKSRILKILQFCESFNKESPRFLLKWDDDQITIECPKFRKLVDEYTQRLIKKDRDNNPTSKPPVSGQNPDSESPSVGILSSQEVEVEVEVDSTTKDKKRTLREKNTGKDKNQDEKPSAPPGGEPDGPPDSDNVIPILSVYERTANKAHEQGEYEHHYELFCEVWPFLIHPRVKRLAYIRWLEHYHINIREVLRRLKRQIVNSKEPINDIVAYVAAFKGKQLQHVEGGW